MVSAVDRMKLGSRARRRISRNSCGRPHTNRLVDVLLLLLSVSLLCLSVAMSAVWPQPAAALWMVYRLSSVSSGKVTLCSMSLSASPGPMPSAPCQLSPIVYIAKCRAVQCWASWSSLWQEVVLASMPDVGRVDVLSSVL